MCVHARKAQGQATEPSKVPTAGKSSFVVAPMGSCYVVLYMYWLCTGCRDNFKNTTQLQPTTLLYFLSPLSSCFSVVGPFAVARYVYTLTSACCRPFFWRRSDGFFMFVADSTRSNNRICISLPSFRNHPCADVAFFCAAILDLAVDVIACRLPTRSTIDYTLWNQGCT